MPGQQARVGFLSQFTPVQLRAPEGLWRLRIGDIFWYPTKCRELLPAPLAYCLGKGGILVIRKILEWRGCAPLFTLEKHRDKRCGEHQSGSDFQASEAYEMTAAFTHGPIANLVVGLQVTQEMMPGEACRRSAMPAAAID
jgi:hypothetical protein